MTPRATFLDLAEELGNLVADRNQQYGEAFQKVGRMLKVLWPDGIPPEAYVDAALMVRMFDKCCRIAEGHHDDSWRDIAGYAVLGWEKGRSEG